MTESNVELLFETVKELVTVTRDFLNADDGQDDDRIIAMGMSVRDVLAAARKNPTLHEWAEDILAELPPKAASD
jgi:hypothetical protein